MRYLHNSSWMLVEQGLKIISGIFVGIYVARFLGPEQFGSLSYALAIVAIFMTVSKLGMESVLVRDLIRYPEQRLQYIGTAFFLMVVGAIISIAVITGLIVQFENDSSTKLYICIISIGLLFQSFLVIDYGFQSQVKAKYSSIAKSAALAISSILKIYLVLIQADLLWFVVAFTFDHLLIAASLIIMYLLQNQPRLFFSFKKSLIKPLLKSAWPMVASGVAGMVMVRLDQIIIKNILDPYQLGLYAAASKIYEGWLLLPFVLSISLLPMLAKLKEKRETKIYHNKLVPIFSLVLWASIAFAFIMTVFGKWLLNITFGPQYFYSYHSLVILSWASVLGAAGYMSARYMVVEGMEKKVARRNWLAVFINIPLNFIMIPIYGIEGAAFSTLISLFIAHYVIDLLDPQLKSLLMVKHRALMFKFSHND